MGFPPRIITVLSLVQFFFITAGYLLTCAGLHRFDRTFADIEFLSRSDAVAWYYSHWPCLTALSFSVRDFGLWPLSLPVIWCVIWVFRTRNTDDLATVELPEALAGIVLTITLALAFSLSTAHAIRMWLGPVIS